MALAVGLTIAFRHFELHALWQSTLLWIDTLGTTGIMAFIVIYNLATVLFIPASLLTLGGGALYGVFWGSVYVIIAATLGAILAFGIGRYFARNWFRRRLMVHPQFQAIDRAVAKEGFKIVFLTRLSPIFPFNLLNYAFGITCVSLKDYTIGSIAMIPGSVMYVYLGSAIGDIHSLGMPQDISPQAQIVQWLFKIVGLLATIAVTLYLNRIAKKALSSHLAPVAISPIDRPSN